MALQLNPRKQRVSLQLMTSCCMNFAITIQWIYFTNWEKIKKNRHHYNTILSFCNIKILQEESNIPWIWRIIYGHKLPYMKKTRKKKQVCGAACFMAAEMKFSKNVRPSVCSSVRLLARKTIGGPFRFFSNSVCRCAEVFHRSIYGLFEVTSFNMRIVALLLILAFSAFTVSFLKLEPSNFAHFQNLSCC